jgi:dimeric dUTPase (all-alpha-NTP-PPase superfamily)
VAVSESWRWLRSTKYLQTNVYGYDMDHLATLEHPDGTAHFLDWNVTAAVQELAEVREEFSWKPWATDQPFVNRDRIRDEIIDVLHFLGNALVAIGVDDEELKMHYQHKQEVNRQRHDSGTYSARKGGLSEGSDVT